MNPGFVSPLATREPERAAARMAVRNPQVAEAFLQAALIAAARLVASPGLGSVRPYVPLRYRFWPLTRYRHLLVYNATTTPVQIVRVVHMRRDLPKLLSRLRD